MASVTFAGVTKRYGDVTAVDDLSIDIADGEFMVLLGPSGCGKSTALRMIAGLESISDGTLRIGDRVVNDVIPAKRDVSLVFQSYALYPHMTVARNIESPLLTRKVPVAERRERLADAARMLGLEPYLERKPGELSGGQRQRVALARAIVSRPSVFLMDEPLSNLDAKLRTQTRAEIVDLHRRLGTTFVYVTHDQVEAMTMADRIAIMSEGRLRQVGTPREVYEAPADLFVAGFIGTPPMNTAPDPNDPTTVIGVRPEHLRVAADGEIAATVHQAEWLGHEALLRVRVDGATADWMVRLPSGFDTPEPGAPVRLHAERVHRFDADTGLRRST
ncbi:MAG TPA: ABC transporter ATP-binding protein [Acidimicrobiales bacterium]|nr:ABC transporter ATP-binding protein [Acidimicrobiales bacterium]